MWRGCEECVPPMRGFRWWYRGCAGGESRSRQGCEQPEQPHFRVTTGRLQLVTSSTMRESFFFVRLGSVRTKWQTPHPSRLALLGARSTGIEACKCLRGLATSSERYHLFFSRAARATPPSPAVSPPAFLACWLLSARDFIARTSAIDSPGGPARSKIVPSVFRCRRQREQPAFTS